MSASSVQHLRVFLCHSNEDKPAVQELYQKLKDDGFQPWFDKEDLLPGQDWKLTIARAVRASDAVVVCLSSTSVAKTGYLNKEIKMALDVADEKPEGTIYIIPLRLEPCEVPDRLKGWQWVNYHEENGYDKLRRALRLRADELGIESHAGNG